jgi:hypothetical protein
MYSDICFINGEQGIDVSHFIVIGFWHLCMVVLVVFKVFTCGYDHLFMFIISCEHVQNVVCSCGYIFF